jgi:PEP-CTERM putative exosortase interaction domain
MFATVGLYAAPQINIDTVLVGNAGNDADTRTTEEGGTPGLGAVSYDYYIGTYEVTTAQYTKFLNSVATSTTAASYITSLYNASMANDPLGCGITRTIVDGAYVYTVANGNVPVNFVSAYDAMRFCNWVTTGNTETGVYNLNGVNSLVGRDTTAMANGGVAIANLDEWYKAAFYNGSTSSYTTYAGNTNTSPVAGVDANFGQTTPYSGIVDVGSYDHFASYYGTFDQNGNVWEWTDTVSSSTNVYRRGGSFRNEETNLRASYSSGTDSAAGKGNNIGFRVVSLSPIPEPSTYAAIFGALALSVAAYRRRK